MDFSGKQFPKEVIIMAVRWYLAYALSYRNIEELIRFCRKVKINLNN
jgi:transposase-like protein